jgi:hypothetical protein
MNKRYINSTKIACYTAFASLLSYEAIAGNSEGQMLTLSGIDGTSSYSETVCPGFSLCFDVFSTGSSGTTKAEIHWDAGIPGAAFIVSNEDMPTGHFCWTPTQDDARHEPQVFRVRMKADNQ